MSERAGRLLLSGELVPGRVRFEDGRITAVERDPAAAPPGAPIVSPGLLDLHVHGFGGHGPLDDLAGMANALARAGTTAFQPTLFPRAPELLGADAERAWRAAQALPDDVATVVGLHLEGPFVNPRAAGALPPGDLAEPSRAALRAVLGPADGDGRGVRTMTIAPELPGCADDGLVAELARCGVRASLGHTRASADDARNAARDGATGATHLFNAMSGVHHRAPGLAAFALSDDALVAELIGDLQHVGREAIEIALRARGPGGLALVSDALAGAGTGCDVFHHLGREAVVAAGAAWFEEPDGRRLAGSATGQLEAARRLVAHGVVGEADALTMATETPARALGLEGELGVLVPGARADLVVLAGPKLALVEVLLGGVALLPAPIL